MDNLNEVRSVARARAQEDFFFFATTVCGTRLTQTQCETVQQKVERAGPEVVASLEVDKCPWLPVRERWTLGAWLVVMGWAPKMAQAPTETFSWLFHDFVERAA